jgi:Gelsolin repeat
LDTHVVVPSPWQQPQQQQQQRDSIADMTSEVATTTTTTSSTAAAAARTKLNWNDRLQSPELLAKIQQAAAAQGPVSFAAVGHTPGIHVGRVVNYTIEPWTQMGKFHKGDCYVILHTHTVTTTPAAQLSHDIYIWIGNESTPDEYGTAAYKVWSQ